MSPSEHGTFHPAARPYRFIVLAFAALMAFGSYFAYDSVGAIETTLIQVFHTDRAAIGTMYTVYGVAAVLALLAGGFFIDRVGVRRASLIFSALVVRRGNLRHVLLRHLSLYRAGHRLLPR